MTRIAAATSFSGRLCVGFLRCPAKPGRDKIEERGERNPYPFQDARANSQYEP
jgi:hypothetical protein